jgi:hypothetical protein
MESPRLFGATQPAGRTAHRTTSLVALACCGAAQQRAWALSLQLGRVWKNPMTCSQPAVTKLLATTGVHDGSTELPTWTVDTEHSLARGPTSQATISHSPALGFLSLSLRIPAILGDSLSSAAAGEPCCRRQPRAVTNQRNAHGGELTLLPCVISYAAGCMDEDFVFLQERLEDFGGGGEPRGASGSGGRGEP